MGRGTETYGMNAERRKRDNKPSLDFRRKTQLPVEGLYIFIPAEIKRVNIKQKEISPSSGALQPL